MLGSCLTRRGFAAALVPHLLGTASQATPQGRRQHANASGGKAGLEPATGGIQSYVFATRLRPLTSSPRGASGRAPVRRGGTLRPAMDYGGMAFDNKHRSTYRFDRRWATTCL